MKYYLAYGSNLNKAQMALRCHDAVPVGTAVLDNTKIVFRSNYKGNGVATLEKEHGCTVPIAIWAISESDEQHLDVYEGYPTLYTKKTVNITLGGKNEKAMIYLMNPGRPETHPSQSYYETIKQGYRDFRFDVHILSQYARKGVSFY